MLHIINCLKIKFFLEDLQISTAYEDKVFVGENDLSELIWG